MGKNDFIKVLASMTPQEINEMLKNKSKPRKLIEPIKFED